MITHNYTREIFHDLTKKGLKNSLAYSRNKAIATFQQTDDTELLKDSLALVDALELAIEGA